MQKGVSFLAVNLLHLALLTGGLALRLLLLGLSAACLLMLAPEDGAANVPACHTVHAICPCKHSRHAELWCTSAALLCLCAVEDSNNRKFMLITAQAISNCNTRQMVLNGESSHTECCPMHTGCLRLH